MDILINKTKQIDELTKNLLTSFDPDISKNRISLIEDSLKIISNDFNILFENVIWVMAAEPSFQLTCNVLSDELWKAFSTLTSLESRSIGCNLNIPLDGVFIRIITNKNGNHISIDAGSSDPYYNLQTISKFIRARHLRINRESVDKWAKQKIKLITMANIRIPSSSNNQFLGD